MFRVARATFQFGLVVAALACGDSTLSGAAGSGGGTDATGGGGGNGGGGFSEAFECVDRGYPCTYAEVPSDVLARSKALGEEALDRMRSEGVMATVEWLSTQDDVVDLTFGTGVVRFRIDQGRPTWITTDPALFERRQAPTASLKGVVGRDLNSDGAINNRDARRALILNPAFGEYDTPYEGAFLSGISSVEAYDGNVVEVKGEAANLSAFGTWRDYDLVWLIAHGKRVCEDWQNGVSLDVCPTGLLTREPADLDSVAVQGVPGLSVFYYVIRGDDGVTSQERVGLLAEADYFRHVYPGGLGRTLVVLNSCEAGDADARSDSVVEPDLAMALRGPETVVFGWTDIVWGDVVAASSAVMIEELAAGRTTQETWDEMTARGVASGEGFYEPQNRTVRAELIGWGDSPLRIREVVTLVDQTGAPLVDGSSVEEWLTSGSGPDSDTLELIATIDGFTEDQLGEVSMRFELDGEPIGESVSLSDANPQQGAGRYQWLVSIPDIDLGRQLEAPDELELEAIVDLPEGGESRFAVELRILGCGFTVRVAGNEVTSQSGDEVSFQAVIGDELVFVTLEQAATGRTTLIAPVEAGAVVAPGAFPGTVNGRIGLGEGNAVYVDDEMNELIVTEYEPTESIKGSLIGTVEVLEGDEPEGRLEPIEVLFEVQVPPDFLPFVGTYKCVVP